MKEEKETVDEIKGSEVGLKVIELHPFDKVLVRDGADEPWEIDFFKRIETMPIYCGKYVCISNTWHECIPYEGHEHLNGHRDNPYDSFVNIVEARKEEPTLWCRTDLCNVLPKKIGDECWTLKYIYDEDRFEVSQCFWDGSVHGMYAFYAGTMFLTREEAEAHKDGFYRTLRYDGLIEEK